MKANTTKTKKMKNTAKEKLTSIRLPFVIEEQLQQAVSLSGLSKADIIRESISKHTEALIQEAIHAQTNNQFVILSEENFVRFAAAIETPTAPNKHLIDLIHGN